MEMYIAAMERALITIAVLAWSFGLLYIFQNNAAFLQTIVTLAGPIVTMVMTYWFAGRIVNNKNGGQ